MFNLLKIFIQNDVSLVLLEVSLSFFFDAVERFSLLATLFYSSSF